MDNKRPKTNNLDKHNPPYTDVSNVVTGNNYIIPEDLPEGAYGAPRGKDTPVENKSTPWEEGQRSYSAFNYEFKSMHEDNPRKGPSAHNTKDDPERETQPPYEDS